MLVNEIMGSYPDTYLVFGVPFFGLIMAFVIICLLTFFGGRLYKWDLNLVYGQVIKKLEELIMDMEELRA